MKGKEHSQPDQHADDPSSRQFTHPSRVPVWCAEEAKKGGQDMSPPSAVLPWAFLPPMDGIPSGLGLPALPVKKGEGSGMVVRYAFAPRHESRGGFFPHIYSSIGATTALLQKKNPRIFPPRCFRLASSWSMMPPDVVNTMYLKIIKDNHLACSQICLLMRQFL